MVDFNCLWWNDRAVTCWMCGMSVVDEVWSGSLLEKLGFSDFESLLCNRRLHLGGHVERSKGPIKLGSEE